MSKINLEKRVPMPEQPSNERIHNFCEVALGYTHEMALEEASRCLNCKNPKCVQGCPVNVNIPSFISLFKSDDIMGAYKVITDSNSLPSICGRVCPQESQCENNCIRKIKGEPVAIGRLERFVADEVLKGENFLKKCKTNGKKVAIVGSGPGGLAAAGELIKRGYKVTVYEALHIPGGVLSYGIPEFRLPKELVKKEINALVKKGVKIECNTVIGRTITIDDLFEKYNYEAIYIGTGAGLPKFMGISGENLNGVYSANEFLTRINLMKAYDKAHFDTPIIVGNKVAVIGGGNVAMDAARCAIRMGAMKVHVIYRRGMDNMPARHEEVDNAKQEGIIFDIFTKPIEIVGKDGNVCGIKCMRTKLSEENGRKKEEILDISGSEFKMDFDTVIMAIGNSPNPLILSTYDKIKGDERGRIIVDENGRTNERRIYAGGDAVTGAATVIMAMGAGRKAAASIDAYLNNND